MISAQNHRQQLSGNNFIITLLVGFLIFSSCSSSKIAKTDLPGKADDYTQIRDTTNIVKLQKPDTIEWLILPEDDFPPIQSSNWAGPGLYKKDVYNISMFLPFFARQLVYDSSATANRLNVDRFVNFYAGVLLAMKTLEEEGVQLNVEVFDTERDIRVFENQLKSFENGNVDLLIGPYDRESLRMAAEWAKKEEVPIISPWQASTRITSKNPYYIQLRPNLERHYEKMITHALENFSRDQIVMLARETKSDSLRLQTLQGIYAGMQTMPDFQPLNEYYIPEDSLLLADSLFYPIIEEIGTVAFIIPNWGSGDEDFIYSCLRKLNVDKGLNDVYVYGMPIVFDSEKISFDLYRNLNIRICRSKFVDYFHKAVREFEKRYFDEYHAIPASDAFEGYDVMMYFGRALNKYGTAFQYYLDNETGPSLQTNYKVERTYTTEDVLIEQFNEINYFENTQLEIIEYKDGRFQRADH